ncbi:GtrA family protein [Blastococcus sp. TF02A-26]|uniref:GtrA family protein n=1 Tax=Blastococcus sp. TF02A-26 TaxID=2250577 RepID=UPI0013141E38|nr:GtrA family protein [Blastococcus sp. TF02A-26]
MTARRPQVGVFLRFLLVNGLNTGLYWGLYLALLLISPYMVANALALVISVLVAYVANARYAFGVETSRSSLARYVVANGSTIVLRMAVSWLMVDVLTVPEQIVPPVAVAVTMPAAFLLTRWAMAVPASTASVTALAEVAPAPRAVARPAA